VFIKARTTLATKSTSAMSNAIMRLCRLRLYRAFVTVLSLFCRKSTVAGSLDIVEQLSNKCEPTTYMNIYEPRDNPVASGVISVMFGAQQYGTQRPCWTFELPILRTSAEWTTHTS